MPAAYKVLGQSNPSATTATTLYTVPSSTSSIVSTLSVANIGSTATTFRIAVRPAGDVLASKHYLAYDVSIPANDTTILTLGLSLATTDVMTVYAGNANLSFSLFGTEIT
jgi:glucose-6-phosphate dehydrogenase assembly protein OpcA